MPNHRPLFLTALSAVCFAVMALAAKLAAGRLPGSEVAFVRFAFMLVPGRDQGPFFVRAV